VLAKRPAALEAALRRAYSNLWAKPRRVTRRGETVTVEGPNIPPRKAKLFDTPSLIARRVAKGDDSEAAWTKLKNEAERLLLAQGGNRHSLKKRMRAGTATPAEMSLAADVLDIFDSKTVRKRGKPEKPSDALGREALRKFLAKIEATLRRRRKGSKERRALTKADIRAVAEQYGVHRNSFYKILKAFPKTAAWFKLLPPGS